MKELINVTDAALYLGITKELLFSYVRYPVKKHLGNHRTLHTEISDGQNYFLKNELNDFDKFLKEPWSEIGASRPPIPTFIQDYLKIENGGKCPITAKGYPLENAHIDPYHISLNHHHHNLIRISKEEHTKIDNGVIPRQLLKDIKLRLVNDVKKQLNLEITTPKLSYTPPKPHPAFIGRSTELMELSNAMEQERLVIIQGIGGIGKTQLLLNAINSVQYCNPLVWIETESLCDIADLEVILKNALSNYFPNTEVSLSEMLLKKNLILVFDSLENLMINNRDQTEDFIHNVISKSDCQILITTQIDLSLLDLRKKTINLKGLDDVNCRYLLNELLPDHILSDDEYDWISGFSGGHPLCLKLISSIIRFHDSGWKAIEQLKVVGLPEQPLRNVHNKSTSLLLCLSTIYKILSDEQKHLLQRLKFYPAGLKIIHAENHFEKIELHNNIAQLRHFFFIDLNRDSLDFERLAILNPIKPFVNKMSECNSAEQEEDLLLEVSTSIMIEALIIDSKYIENGTYGTPEYGIKRLENELPNILEAFTVSQAKALLYKENNDKELENKFLNITAGIASALGKFCWARGFFSYGTLFAEAGISANLQLERFESVSMQYMYLSQIYSRRGDRDKFSEIVNALNNLAFETRIVDIYIHYAWSNGRLLLDEQNYIEALTFFKRAARLINIQLKKSARFHLKNPTSPETSVIHYWGNLSLLISEIGRVYEFSGNYIDAAKEYEKSIEIHNKFNDETNLLSLYYHYANCLIELNMKEKAISYYLMAIQGFKDHGQHDYLLNTFASIGISIEENIDILEHECFDEETYEYILDSLNNQLYYIINTYEIHDINNLDHLAPLLVGQLTCVTKMFSFSKFGMMLTEWITELYYNNELKNEKYGYVIAIFSLAHAVGAVNEWKNIPESKEEMTSTILLSCLTINGGSDLKSKTKIFYWLETWMKFTKLDVDATAESLLEKAWKSLEI